MDLNDRAVLHPAGETVFTFPTYGDQVRLCPIEDALTPYGGLVPWAAFQKRCGLIEALAKSCPVERTSPNAAPVYDVLTSFGLTALAARLGLVFYNLWHLFLRLLEPASHVESAAGAVDGFC